MSTASTKTNFSNLSEKKFSGDKVAWRQLHMRIIDRASVPLNTINVDGSLGLLPYLLSDRDFILISASQGVIFVPPQYPKKPAPVDELKPAISQQIALKKLDDWKDDMKELKAIEAAVSEFKMEIFNTLSDHVQTIITDTNTGVHNISLKSLFQLLNAHFFMQTPQDLRNAADKLDIPFVEGKNLLEHIAVQRAAHEVYRSIGDGSQGIYLDWDKISFLRKSLKHIPYYLQEMTLFEREFPVAIDQKWLTFTTKLLEAEERKPAVVDSFNRAGQANGAVDTTAKGTRYCFTHGINSFHDSDNCNRPCSTHVKGAKKGAIGGNKQTWADTPHGGPYKGKDAQGPSTSTAKAVEVKSI